jgi:acyl carrier protein
MTTVKETKFERLILYGITAAATIGLGIAGPIRTAFSTPAWTIGISLAFSVAAFAYVFRRIKHDEQRQIESVTSGRRSFTAEEFGKEYFTGVAVPIAAACREIFAENYELDSSRIHPDDKLCADLRFAAHDCLDANEFLAGIEKRFQIKFSKSEMKQMRTMRDIVDVVAAKSTGSLEP